MWYSIIHFIGLLFALISLPGTLELSLLTLAAIFSGQSFKKSDAKSNLEQSALKIAVVMPAHNEAAGIAKCIASVQRSAEFVDHFDIIVIADNCTDDTAEKARQAGARVLVRNNPDQRGKGFALDYAFQTLWPENHQGFLVLDADSRVDVNLLMAFKEKLAEGWDAVQCRYRIANPEATTRTQLQYLAGLAFNELRLLGRETLGVSVGILGNGFMLSRATLEKVPYQATSITEDLEYHLRLVQAGFRVHFLPTTLVYADAPCQDANAQTQRSRWEGGRLRMIIEHSPGLTRALVGGQWRMLEPLAELWLLPLGFHVILLFLALLAGDVSVCYYAIGAFTMLGIHVLAAIFMNGGGWREIKVLFMVPAYVLWKLRLLPSLWRSASNSTAWQRTGREK
jgi:cellulose synthase/poly-beta-1,6-N-acetylglucosamine synthase-like glycosyltransferase